MRKEEDFADKEVSFPGKQLDLVGKTKRMSRIANDREEKKTG